MYKKKIDKPEIKDYCNKYEQFIIKLSEPLNDCSFDCCIGCYHKIKEIYTPNDLMTLGH
jgi:hypothetical protein